MLCTSNHRCEWPFKFRSQTIPFATDRLRDLGVAFEFALIAAVAADR